MALRINQKHFESIRAYGAEAYPNECCGFLLGEEENGDKCTLATIPANNAQDDLEKYHRFLISPEVFLRSERLAKVQGMDIIGFYHSHPNAEAKPSKYDIEHAWPWYSYVIVAVTKNGAHEVTSWILEDDRSRFKQEQIIIK